MALRLLAQSFVDDYLRERGLAIDGPLVFPRLVTGLACPDRTGTGRAALDTAGSGLRRSGRAPVRRRRCRPECRSRALPGRPVGIQRPGRPTRRALPFILFHSVLHGIESEQGVAVQVMAIGEVADVRAVWERGVFCLSWQKPIVGCETLIYRALTPFGLDRTGPAPVVDQPGAILSPWSGSHRGMMPRRLQAGDTYHYRGVFLAPLWGRFSDGVASSVRTPIRPPAVSAVEATCAQGRVDVSWQPVRGPQSGAYRYVVVRREGRVPPAQPDDGLRVAEVQGGGCSDTQVMAGRCYSYAAFTWTGEVFALRPGTCGPVDVFAEVSGLVATPADATVELRWRNPENAIGVVVRRDLAPPAGPSDGIAVPLTGAAAARATDLENGVTQHFLRVGAFRRPDEREILSPGLRIEAIPEADPVLIEGYSCLPRDRTCYAPGDAPSTARSCCCDPPTGPHCCRAATRR